MDSLIESLQLPMPPRWPRQPTRSDPEYRRLDDRMNFAIHVGLFAATNSGLWFFRNLQPNSLQWLSWFTLSWIALLFIHAIYIFAIANYEEQRSPDL